MVVPTRDPHATAVQIRPKGDAAAASDGSKSGTMGESNGVLMSAVS